MKRDEILLGEAYGLINNAKYLVAKGYTFEEAYSFLKEMDMRKAEEQGAMGGFADLLKITGKAAKSIAAGIVIALAASSIVAPEVRDIMAANKEIKANVEQLQKAPDGGIEQAKEILAADQVKQESLSEPMRQAEQRGASYGKFDSLQSLRNLGSGAKSILAGLAVALAVIGVDQVKDFSKKLKEVSKTPNAQEQVVKQSPQTP